jgi:hypothetical protein
MPADQTIIETENSNSDASASDSDSILSMNEVTYIESVPVFVFKLRPCTCSNCRVPRVCSENSQQQNLAKQPSRFVRKPKNIAVSQSNAHLP